MFKLQNRSEDLFCCAAHEGIGVNEKTPKNSERIVAEASIDYPLAGERRADVLQELRALFKTTQATPVAQTISEEEIAAEIAAYRTEE